MGFGGRTLSASATWLGPEKGLLSDRDLLVNSQAFDLGLSKSSTAEDVAKLIQRLEGWSMVLITEYAQSLFLSYSFSFSSSFSFLFLFLFFFFSFRFVSFSFKFFFLVSRLVLVCLPLQSASSSSLYAVSTVSFQPPS